MFPGAQYSILYRAFLRSLLMVTNLLTDHLMHKSRSHPEQDYDDSYEYDEESHDTTVKRSHARSSGMSGKPPAAARRQSGSNGRGQGGLGEGMMYVARPTSVAATAATTTLGPAYPGSSEVCVWLICYVIFYVSSSSFPPFFSFFSFFAFFPRFLRHA